MFLPYDSVLLPALTRVVRQLLPTARSFLLTLAVSLQPLPHLSGLLVVFSLLFLLAQPLLVCTTAFFFLPPNRLRSLPAALFFLYPSHRLPLMSYRLPLPSPLLC